MAEDIAGLLGVKVTAIANIIQWLAAIVGAIIFLLFFALAPLHALILSGLLVILASLYFKAEKSIQKAALYIGVGLMAVGMLGIFVPQVTRELLSIAEELKELLVFPFEG
jgi:hypothetical protein